MSKHSEQPIKVTAPLLGRMKLKGEKIVALTAYDYPTALVLDQVGVDLVLVGDSAANVVYGMATTLSIGMEEMLYHTRAVAAGLKRALLVADMPFMSYQTSTSTAVENAGRFLKIGAEAVKVEGAGPVVETVARLVELGIPVLGHLGLTPQSVHKLGGYRLQAKRQPDRAKLLDDARRLEEAGCFALVLEKVPAELGVEVSQALRIPVIGIGAGPGCDGQILVLHDLVGAFDEPAYKFVKRYAQVVDVLRKAVGDYAREVRSGEFPDREHSFYVDGSR